MEAVLYVVGALWIVVGSFVVLYTEKARRWSRAILRAISLKAVALLAIVTGVLLMLSAPWSHSLWLVEALGALALIEGALLLLLRGERGDWLSNWWMERASDVTWRLGGLIGVILGVFLVLRL
jgi:uncharacterized membrane protein HdeD (DUF308 family)